MREWVAQWGNRAEEARARMATITAEEMLSQGVTLKMAVEWRDYYARVTQLKSNNPSAWGRVDLMEYTAELIAEWIAEQEEAE